MQPNLSERGTAAATRSPKTQCHSMRVTFAAMMLVMLLASRSNHCRDAEAKAMLDQLALSLIAELPVAPAGERL